MNRRYGFIPIMLAALGLILLVDAPAALAIISIQRPSSSDESTRLAPWSGVTAMSLDSALVWNTFLGGTSGEQGYGIAVDESGNLYLAEVSNGTWGSPIRPYADAGDAFVVKQSLTRSEKLFLPLIVR
jgi:hypothetical protein